LYCLYLHLGSGIIVSHDRWFLDRIATHILSFEPNAEDPDRGEGKVSFFEGSYSEWDALRRKQAQDAKQKKKFKNIVLS
jgi:sulfate-transporting ATPase